MSEPVVPHDVPSALRDIYERGWYAGKEAADAQVARYREAIALTKKFLSEGGREGGHRDGPCCAYCDLRAALDRLDPEPQPGDGPDYHAEHVAWRRRNFPLAGDRSGATEHRTMSEEPMEGTNDAPTE